MAQRTGWQNSREGPKSTAGGQLRSLAPRSSPIGREGSLSRCRYLGAGYHELESRYA